MTCTPAQESRLALREWDRATTRSSRPTANHLSFIRDHGIFVVHLKYPSLPALAVAPGKDAILNGEVDWVYEEELETRSNTFWSPDSKKLAYLQMNETNVPVYPITDWLPTHARVVAQSYPQPGDPNPEVRVGVMSAQGGKTVWVRLPIQAGQDYIPRFGWVDSQDAVDRDAEPRPEASRSLLCRGLDGGGAPGAATERREVLRRQVRRVGGRWLDRADGMGGRTQSSLSLQL